MSSLAIKTVVSLAFLVAICGIGFVLLSKSSQSTSGSVNLQNAKSQSSTFLSDRDRIAKKYGNLRYKPRQEADSSGYKWVMEVVKRWPKNATIQEIGANFKGAVAREIKNIDQRLMNPSLSKADIITEKYLRSNYYNFEGNPSKAYQDLTDIRNIGEASPQWLEEFLYTVIFMQGITSLRRGENENCIMCRGESSCILPIAKSAIHKIPEGSRLAIKHFLEYLEQFPEEMDVRWLLNVAYMTLGEYPSKVPPQYLVPMDRFFESEVDIGKFRDIGHIVGLNRFNQAGGGIMDDFDNDGRLDVVVSTFDPTVAMGVYMSDGKGRFENWTEKAGTLDQLGGLNCMQTDYNNDGFKDVFIVRGAWLLSDMAMRPTLLRNNGDRTFTDVTIEAKLDEPVNSITASWADYDNDGWLDVMVCSERQRNRLYHNQKDGTFEEVAETAGLAGLPTFQCKGIAWFDYDQDGYQDLFLNHLSTEGARLFHNNHDGTFSDVSLEMGIKGPFFGFSCWAWDFNNDGFQDIYATSYDYSLGDAAYGLIGLPHKRSKNALYTNVEGKGFKDVTEEYGLDQVHITMGSNFADFDNDGFLDMYLGTGDPSITMLVPNRMFKNVEGKRFVDISTSSGTGHLQKGHGVACGDWDADGNVDLFIEMGGAINGDKYHNILFQNPGHDNNWVNVCLTGKTTNRVAIGARIKVVTKGEKPQTIYRHVTSGSSFGANPLEQCIGIGHADGIESIEIYWPTSNTTQKFENVVLNRFYEVTEGVDELKSIERSRIELDLSAK